MGSGVSEYGGEAPILSEPRGRFAYFAATGKVGRRPQAAKSPLRKMEGSGGAPSRRALHKEPLYDRPLIRLG